MKDAHVIGCRLYWLRPPLTSAGECGPPIRVQIEEILRSNEVAGIFIGTEGAETNKTTAKKRARGPWAGNRADSPIIAVLSTSATILLRSLM
jgi:hypothetical protein